MAAPAPLNLSQTMARLGFKTVNPYTLLNELTGSFGRLIETVFEWVYFLSEIAVLVGGVVFLVGSIGRHARVKKSGMAIALYGVLGFGGAVILPGVIVAINNYFHG